jgi:hypothetical protein
MLEVEQVSGAQTLETLNAAASILSPGIANPLQRDSEYVHRPPAESPIKKALNRP